MLQFNHIKQHIITIREKHCEKIIKTTLFDNNKIKKQELRVKQYLSIFTIASLLFLGCGGVDSKNSKDSSSNQSSVSETEQESIQQEGSVVLPNGFKSFESFKVRADGATLLDHSIGELYLLPLSYYSKLTPQIMAFQLIQNNSDLIRRSHCEKGSATVVGAYYEKDVDDINFGSARGDFIFDMSSGIEQELVSDTDSECSSGELLDGHVAIDATRKNYDSDTISSLIEIELGTSSGYFFDGFRVGSYAYKGKIKEVSEYALSNSSQVVTSAIMEIFSLQKEPERPLSKGAYIKEKQTVVRNYRYKLTTSKENNEQISTKETSFEVTWSENRETFVMQYHEIIRDDLKGFYYEVYNIKSPHNSVKASLEIKNSTYLYSYTRDGKTQTDTVEL